MEKKEAMKILKDFHDKSALFSVRTALDTVIPELKESKVSKDERIRKDLLNYLYDVHDDDEERARWIAWLKKQAAPQVRTGIEWVNTIDDACDKRYAEEYAHGEYCHEQFFKWGFQEGVDWLEKQDEQQNVNVQINPSEYINDMGGNGCYLKSTDKIEPKFKVGDWIVYNRDNYSREIIQVYDIRDDRYYFTDNVHLSWSIKECDEKSHLWTIQDAKNGDVLAVEVIEENYQYPFVAIYKERGLDFFNSYCSIGFNGKFHEADTGHLTEKIHPATKEQRDLLFQKMKEARYEWDSDKKELKKVEQYSCQWPAIWCEEDEYRLDSTVSTLEEYAKTRQNEKPFLGVTLDNISWLKSFKYRIQLKQEWSKEDERTLLRLIAHFDWNGNTRFTKEDCQDVTKWLKSLKERYAWKPSSELDEASYQVGIKRVLENPESYGLTKYNWKPSDEYKEAIQLVYDEKLIPFKDGNQWCFLLGYNIQEGVCGFGDSILEAAFEFYKEYTTTRKCIGELPRPQSYFSLWKPSDEQMKAFDSVLVYNPPCSNECRNHLITLYNDLEKLRKE